MNNARIYYNDIRYLSSSDDKHGINNVNLQGLSSDDARHPLCGFL